MKFIITQYRITGCWYGRKKSDTSVKPEELLSVLDGFCKWVEGTSHMSHTLIQGKGYPFKVYVKDCAFDKHDFLVALWLSASEKEANIYAINENDPPNGTQKVARKSFKKGEIPGFPAYFFIDADNCLLYTLRPMHILVNGRAQFDAALKFYMENHAGEIQKEKRVLSDGTIAVDLNMVGSDGETLTPKFESTLQKVSSATETLKKRFQEIRKIVHTQDISKKTKDEKQTLIRKAFEVIGATLDDSDVSDSRRIKCEVDVRLTLEEVEEFVRKQDEVRSNERFGFKFKGDQKTMWADTCIAKKELDIPVETKDDMPIEAKALLAALEKNRASVVR